MPSPTQPSLAGRRIAVFGSSTLTPDTSGWQLAEQLGEALARAGAGILNGGYGGAMAAVSQGARRAGGQVIGVTLDGFRDRVPNPHLSDRVHAETLIERLGVLFQAEGFVALEGSVGTLTELFLAWNHAILERPSARPLVCLGMVWPGFLAALQSLRLVDDPELLTLVEWAKDPDQAVAALARRLAESTAIES